MKNIKDIYKKYNLFILIGSIIFNLYFLFSPKEIKILKTEKTKIVKDTVEINRLKSEIQKLEQRMVEEKKNLEIIETVKETRYTDGKIEILTEKKTIDKSELKENVVTQSSNTTSSETQFIQNIKFQTETLLKQEISKQKFWVTLFGYNHFTKQIELGQGVNIFNFSFVGCGIYNTTNNSFDLGLKILIKY